LIAAGCAVSPKAHNLTTIRILCRASEKKQPRHEVGDGQRGRREQDHEEDHAAPEGKLRLIGEDTFVWPPEEHIIGDYDDKEESFAEADKRRHPGIIVGVYNDMGVQRR
jgi:hypothetical protein